MEKRCDEPHCLQIVPEHLWMIHQDQHFAERLIAEEFEDNRLNEVHQTLARGLTAKSANSEILENQGVDADYQLALALNQEVKIEGKQSWFPAIQVEAFLKSFDCTQKTERGTESLEEDHDSNFLKPDEPRSNFSHQLTLGPNLTPIRSQLLSNQTPGTSNRKQLHYLPVPF